MSGAISQSGPVVAGHIPVFLADGTVQDGDAAGAGVVTQIGITNNGNLALGINSGLISGPYTQFGVQVSSNGTVTLSAQSFNGNPSAAVVWNLNGVLYPLNPSGSGNITGPSPVIDNDLVAYNGTTGNLVKDSGISLSRVVQGATPVTSGHLVSFDTTAGNHIADSGLPVSAIVTGPTISVDGDLALFNGVSGNALRDSGVLLSSLVQNNSSLIIPPLANVAALVSATSATLSQNICYVKGYYSKDDGGEGFFVIGADTASDGGLVINDSSARSWYRLVGADRISIKWFGCKGDLSSDCSARLYNCLAAAAGRLVYAPAGQYLVNSTVSYNGIVNIVGDGNGCGPGPAAISNTNCTQFMLGTANNGLFNITTNYACSFRDFQINVMPAGRPQASGSGISISGPIGSTNANSLIDGVGFSNLFNPILLTRCSAPVTNRVYMDGWIFAGIYIQTSPGIEGSGGKISHSFFFGPADAAGTQGVAIYSQVGYIFIHDNLFTGGQGAIDIVAQTFPAGAPLIHDNTIEDYRLFGINLNTVDGNEMSMIRIHGNEFSNVAFGANAIASIVVADNGSPFLSQLSIRGNVFRVIHGATSSVINVSSGKQIIVSENIIENLGGAMNNAIGVTGVNVVGPAMVHENQITGAFTIKYGCSSVVVVHDTVNSLAYADLSAWANGSYAYVTNGAATAAGNPILVGGGSGATAFRARGNWYTGQYGVTG